MSDIHSKFSCSFRESYMQSQHVDQPQAKVLWVGTLSSALYALVSLLISLGGLLITDTWPLWIKAISLLEVTIRLFASMSCRIM